MALPVSFDADLSVGLQNSYHGPFKSSGGAFYTVLRGRVAGGDGLTISLHKATDPTSSFAEQGQISMGGGSGVVLQSVWCYQKGDTVDVAGQYGSAGDEPFFVHHTTASLSADTLAFSTEVDTAPIGDDGPNAAAFCHKRWQYCARPTTWACPSRRLRNCTII